MKVLLAEDNYQMLEFMYQCVPWEEHGFEVTGRCATGMEAWTSAREDMPDMVITDISMPGMDGLELIEKVRAVNPELESIIITCHDDFEYARKALRLYVGDYILKETLEPGMLLKAVQQMKKKLEEHQADRTHMDALQTFVEYSKKPLKKEWIHSFLHGTEERSDVLSLSFDTTRYVPVSGRFLDAQEEGAESIVEEAGRAVLEEADSDYVIASPGEMYWFFPYHRGMTADDVSMQLTKIQRYVQRETGQSLVFVTGNHAGTYEELRTALEQVTPARGGWFYITEPGVFTAEQLTLKSGHDDIFMHYTTALYDLKKIITEEDAQAAEAWLQSWMNEITDKAWNPEQVKSWIHKILIDIDLKYQSLQHYSDKPSSVLYSEIHALRHTGELEAYLRAYVQQKMTLAAHLRESSDRREIWEAKKYVETHLDQKITMEGAANHLHLNPSHFSRIFKQETGETFVEYTTKKKMEQASHDLLYTNHTVDDIALSIGYDNTSYFTKLFRKFSGFSPKQYRKDK